jgi:Ca-activated chloride channel family protein
VSSPVNPVKVRAAFDRSLAWEGGQSVRYLGVTVSGEAPPGEAPRRRPPLNLALVIDASGSMGGGKLDAARKAAQGLVEYLAEHDVLSLVSFSNDVITHLEPCLLSADGKRAALQSLEGLSTRGATNLSGGWLRGAECIASYQKTRADCHNHVLLLTDGQANEGIVDPRELGHQAERLSGRGISSSAVGIGDDYSTDQITVIANNGGGQFHHANTPQHIIEVVQGELSELAGTVAENVAVEVGYPAGASVEVVGDFPVSHDGQKARCSIGSVIAGGKRLAIFKVTAPAGAPGGPLPFHPRVQFTPVGSQASQTVETDLAILRFADGPANEAQPRQVELSLEVARVWQSTVLRRALQLNRDRLYTDAQRLLQEQLVYFERYCAGLPNTAALVQEMKDALRNASADWGEGMRKEAEVRHYKQTRQQADHRKHP